MSSFGGAGARKAPRDGVGWFREGWGGQLERRIGAYIGVGAYCNGREVLVVGELTLELALKSMVARNSYKARSGH